MRSYSLKFAASVAAAFALICNTSNSSLAATLFGGVSHSDFLAPVDPVHSAPQQPVAPQVQQQSLPETISPTLGGSARATVQHPAIEWFPIPKWMAGQWTKNGDLTKTVTDLRTGITSPVNEFIEDRMTVTWGYQTDSQGNVWHAHFVPSEREGESQGKAVSFLIINLKVLEATPQNLATRTHYIVKESVGQQVTDIFQQESLTHYALVGGPNRMDALSSNRVFSYQGQPKRDGSMISHYERTANYQPIASKQGVDLAASLNEYLRTHNLAGLTRQVQAVTPAQEMTPAQSQAIQPAVRQQQLQQPQYRPTDVSDPLQKIDPNNPF